MELQTQRLLLRPWQEDDADELYKYAKDLQVGPAAGWPVHTSVENSREIIRTVLSAVETYAVVLKQTCKPVGSIGLMIGRQSNIGLPDNECEVGYWIARPYWGKGICTEALGLVIDHCFGVKGFSTLWGTYFPSNPASGRVMEKCGFVDTGRETVCPNLEVGSDQPVRVMRKDNDRLIQ